MCAHPRRRSTAKRRSPWRWLLGEGSRGPVIWSLEEVRDEPFRLPVHSSLHTSSIVRRPRWRGTTQKARLSLKRATRK